MNFTCLPERGEEFWPVTFSGTDALAPSNTNPTANGSCFSASETEPCQRSRSSATSAISTVDPTEAALMSWLADFPAKPTPPRLREKALLTTSGRKCDGSWQMSLPGTYLPRTSSKGQSTAQQTTSKRWVTPSDAWRFPRQTWVVTTFGSGIGLLAHADMHGELRSTEHAEMAERSSFRPGVWQTEPNEPRMADELAVRVDRLEATGDGQIPIVAATAWRILTETTA